MEALAAGAFDFLIGLLIAFGSLMGAAIMTIIDDAFDEKSNRGINGHRKGSDQQHSPVFYEWRS